MLRSRVIISTLLISLAFTLAPRPTAAQEVLGLGKMWTFENVPQDYFKEVHGFELSQEWLDAVRLASLRFGSGCSASFVSPRGLVMTNHHCARDHIARISPPDQDWVKNGFVAKTMKDEVPIPGLAVQQLVSMRDVTARMNAGLENLSDAGAIQERRQANEQAVLTAAGEKHPDLTARLVTLYQGGSYQLYLYKLYTDVRLVCAPHLQTAHFGGDPDNFTYPRYCIDFCFCRAYEDGKPVDSSKSHFKFDATGPEEGESVFITGNPGSTDRLMTFSQMEYTRDVRQPIILDLISGRLSALRAEAERGPERAKAVRTATLGMENADKAYRGYQAGLLDASLMAAKKESEAAFREKIEADPKLAKRFGSAWERLAEITERRRTHEPRRRYHSDLGSPLMKRALALVGAKSTEKLVAAAAISMKMSELERDQSQARVKNALRWLPKNDAFRAVLAKGLDKLAAASRIDDDEKLTTLIDGGPEAIAASNDPALVLARKLKGMMKENGREGTELTAAEEVEKSRIGQALFAVYGHSVSPDATSSLRLSDGKVKGFPYNGTIAPWWTSFYGLYARSLEFGNHHPFDLPQPWLDHEKKIDLKTPINFVATNDIIGGNSGSPVIDKQRRIVGLVFDGNIEMLSNRYLYRDDLPRSVSVHSAAILECLRKIYGAKHVARELLGK